MYDFAIIGSGFGGSVSALRLAEKGYSVLVLERGKRFRDEDFAKSTWDLRRYLWAPALRCFGILQISPFRDVVVLHGSGVGGGSLGYANVLVQPEDETLAAPEWSGIADFRNLLRPHYDTARRMLGVAANPRLGPADDVLRAIATELGTADSFQPTTVGAYFGKPGSEGVEVPDPYFGGEGPRAPRLPALRRLHGRAAATTPRTRSSRTTSGSPRSAASRCAPSARCATSGRSAPTRSMARATSSRCAARRR